jgi:alpha-D-xyloside xylohydrolase
MPKGCDWFNFYTNERYAGGTTIEVTAPLDTIPLFVKDGSIIPMTAPALSTEEQTGETEYRHFGDVTTPYEMYDDAGDGYGYEKGEYTIKEVI